MAHIWVVELLNKINYQWEPTYDTMLSREEARKKIHSLKLQCPNYKHRIRKYERKMTNIYGVEIK